MIKMDKLSMLALPYVQTNSFDLVVGRFCSDLQLFCRVGEAETRIPSSLWCNPFQPLPWSSISAAEAATRTSIKRCCCAVESCWNVGSAASKRGHAATGLGVPVIQGVHWSWCRTYWDSVAPRTLGLIGNAKCDALGLCRNKALHFFDRQLGFPLAC